MSEARDAIFGAIRHALGPARAAERIRAEADALLAEPERVRPRLPDGDLASLFEAAVTRLPPGASCERIADFAALPAAVAAHLHARGREPAIKLQPALALLTLPFAEAGVALRDEVDDRTALSLSDCAIAETASLVIRSGADMAVLDAFLPLHHLVAVRVSDIVPHLEEAVARFDLARSRNLVVVTGPSGTTDIEGNLVIGVHGPATLHIFLIEDGAA
ncbi:LutC/YkgG family protein [Aureimonas ureilytica]|uniref:LutC/YkgG family protein n=1 Tax=Aureimonas ureilytica TaxID=401562 RepID=UPI000379ECE0|nr:LUD domain-containing protein [Aureimonas ureilytica]